MDNRHRHRAPHRTGLSRQGQQHEGARWVAVHRGPQQIHRGGPERPGPATKATCGIQAAAPNWAGPGGPNWAGPGGPNWAGPGGPNWAGPGGPNWAGPGGPNWAGPGGPNCAGPG